jgi:hypothetical protein
MYTVCVYAAHWPFWSTPRPIHPFFLWRTPRVCHLVQPFSLQSFFFPNDLFSGWLSFFSVHLCSFSIFFFIALVMNYYFRSLIPNHVFYPYPSHWSTTPAAVQSSHVIGGVLVNLSTYHFYTLLSTFICTYHPLDLIVLFVLSQPTWSVWFSLLFL